MDYTGVVRSSYFKVVDDEAYEAFKTHIATDDLKFQEKEDEDGSILHAFGRYSDIYGYVEDYRAYMNGEEEADYSKFMTKLSELIAEGSACVIQNVGHEGLRYISGSVTVITTDISYYKSIDEMTSDLLYTAGIDPRDVELAY